MNSISSKRAIKLKMIAIIATVVFFTSLAIITAKDFLGLSSTLSDHIGLNIQNITFFIIADLVTVTLLTIYLTRTAKILKFTNLQKILAYIICLSILLIAIFPYCPDRPAPITNQIHSPIACIMFALFALFAILITLRYPTKPIKFFCLIILATFAYSIVAFLVDQNFFLKSSLITESTYFLSFFILLIVLPTKSSNTPLTKIV